MNYNLILAMTGVMFFVYWFVYIVGDPLSHNPRTREIFSWLPLLLASRRLKKSGQLVTMKKAYADELEMTKDPQQRRGLLNDHLLDVIMKGRELFTWEKFLFCAICLHWWLTILVAIFFLSFDILGARADFWLGVFSYLFTHFLIRKISNK